MKRNMSLSVIISLTLFLAGCYEGYTGKDGAALKEYLEPAKLKELTEKPKHDIWIVDVRPAEAFRKGHIPTAKNFPSGEIMDRLGEIPKSQNIITYCETGGRSQMVLKELEKKGYTKFMNWGGYSRYFNIYGPDTGKAPSGTKASEKR